MWGVSWGVLPFVSMIEMSGSSGTSEVAKKVPPMICDGPSAFATGGRLLMPGGEKFSFAL